MAEVPDTLRQRLGWGQLHRLQVAPGTLVLYPAWLQHGALMPRTGEGFKGWSFWLMFEVYLGRPAGEFGTSLLQRIRGLLWYITVYYLLTS